MRVSLWPFFIQLSGGVTEGTSYAFTFPPFASEPPQGNGHDEDPELTRTVTDERGEVPPGPVHWNVNVVSEVRGSVRPLPERLPEFDHGPPAVQLVASVEDQSRVARPPEAIGFGDAVMVAVGTDDAPTPAIVVNGTSDPYDVPTLFVAYARTW